VQSAPDIYRWCPGLLSNLDPSHQTLLVNTVPLMYIVQCTVKTNGVKGSVLRRLVVNTDLSNVVYGEHCRMFNAF
jgi:hypothetical protein